MGSQDFLTLEEAAKGLKKSAQTVRRMIKRGELPAKRVKTPQGYNYVVNREDIFQSQSETLAPEEPISVEETPVPVGPEKSTVAPEFETKPESSFQLPFTLPPLPTQKVDRALENLPFEAWVENDYFDVERTSIDTMMKVLELQHKEKMMLIHILEKLQDELNKPSEPSPSLLERLRRWFSI